MGEVYRAEDTNLSRQIAIKVLPDEFAHDAERLARFQREAQVLASLNHPNIATLYDLEESDGQCFIVMELVEGQTLARRLLKGPMPVEEALEVCRQIAEGLEYANEHGIIHRDLKPANIKLRPDGAVKILDFGLARALQPDVATSDMSRSPTITAAATRAGVILGAAAYMSPEQARGETLDQRTDIWALGCVLYEVLTGRQAFQGDTISDTLAAVLRADPGWDVLPAEVTTPLRDLLRRCLAKDPKQRLHAVADARLEVQAIASEPAAGSGRVSRGPCTQADAMEITGRGRGRRRGTHRPSHCRITPFRSIASRNPARSAAAEPVYHPYGGERSRGAGHLSGRPPCGGAGDRSTRRHQRPLVR